MLRWVWGVWLLGSTCWAGTLEGEVVIQSHLARKPKGLLRKAPAQAGANYQDRDRLPQARGEVDEVRHVVISLPGTPGGPTTPEVVSLTQRNRQFEPYVLPIYQGTTVEFPNADTIFHSVYSRSECRPFHLPEYPQGQSRRISFPQVGLVELFCAIHPEMNAYITVLDTYFFTQPDEHHRFRLENIPAGRRKLQAWHPRLASRIQMVDVPAQGTVQLKLTL